MAILETWKESHSLYLSLPLLGVVTCFLSPAETYKLDIDDVYLVHDDLDKTFGKVSLKLGGSARYLSFTWGQLRTKCFRTTFLNH